MTATTRLQMLGLNLRSPHGAAFPTRAAAVNKVTFKANGRGSKLVETLSGAAS